MNNYTIFVSDLHLSSTTIDTTKLFINFLENISPETDAIYILGDLFSFWIGDDNSTMFNEEIKSALKKASLKTPIYLMQGNRDFLLGEKFAQESGCTLLSDPHTIDLYGKKTILTHGDLFLCSNDSKYKLFRTIIRFPGGIKLFLKLPLAFRSWFAKNIQKLSVQMKAKKKKSNKPFIANPPDILNLLKKTDSEQIIYGHFHVADVTELNVGDETARSISLGEWDAEGNALVYNNNHQIEFKKITA